jgi:hypothetical protein
MVLTLADNGACTCHYVKREEKGDGADVCDAIATIREKGDDDQKKK